ncbi:MAG: hypothetical protein JNL82_34980 [Myxococcales bacterium]|nr:hypothetical protein [Myxococcales bacterium]
MARDDDTRTEQGRLIAAYRRRAEPPPEAAARAFAALRRRIAADEPDPLAGSDEPAPPARRPWLLGLAAAAALLLTVGLSYGTAQHGSARAAVEAAYQRVFAPSRPTRAAPPPTAARPVSAPAQQPAPADMPREPAPEGPPPGDLERQLAQVQAAADAARAGDGAAALARADAYLKIHPTGTFAPEARLHRAAALCLLGQVDAARRAAAEFERDYPTSPLVARIAAVCAP